MKKYLKNIWVKIAFVMVVFGWAPLWGIVMLAAIGLWPDPNPNPTGAGLLFFFSFASRNMRGYRRVSGAAPTRVAFFYGDRLQSR